MKRYNSLAELLIDYREFKNLTQLDVASMLNVDTRTISRWEKGQSLIKYDKLDDVCEVLFLPHQVLINLNSEHPISIYYDMDARTYSFSSLGTKIANTQVFTSGLPVEDESIHELSDENDLKFISEIKTLRTDRKPLKHELIRFAAKVLPELNLILFDQAGFYAGHISFLALKEGVYEKLKSRELEEEGLTLDDLDDDLSDDPKIFYFYSLYADSLSNAHFLMSRILRYFKKNAFKNYLVSGQSYFDESIDMHREMGLRIIWEDEERKENYPKRTFVEGNYDMFLFGKAQ